MAEVDYQMALLLQYKLEQEHKRKEPTDSDHKLALELQEQFRAEAEVEKPANNLVYKVPPALNNSKCLVDPSWEVIDPTPDVHILFIAFNQKFFWNTLGSVTVSWSKRMTTCAGICSYQGRGGMCSITLSEPLLKLRPRKDLVETLLHEMIHAYLFVTNNNRDRDGHGPEFHKHMYRINAEAGTNISVYHDFHDEVKLYQQHWWRCDGPCQHRKPYFGMIRRATNRAPGPNDRWWEEHVRNCGGVFVKVKSPEKPVKEPKTSKKKPDPPKETSPKNDIRNYITSTGKGSLPTNTQSLPTKSNQVNATLPTVPDKVNKPSSTITRPSGTTNNALPNNVRTVSSNSDSAPHVSNVIPSKTNNIFGFTNLGGASSITKKPGGNSGVKGAVKNAGSSTFVVTKKGSTTTTTSTDTNGAPDRPSSISTTDLQPFSGTGRPLSSSGTSSLGNRDYSAVRDHWLKKFDNNSPSNSQQNGLKRPSASFTSPVSQKIPKLANFDDDDEDKNKVQCPVCNKKIKADLLNTHLDNCLESPRDDSKECIICGVKITTVDFEKHVSDCTAKHFGDDNFEDEVFSKSTQCPICLQSFDPKTEPDHAKICKRANLVDLPSCSNEEQETKLCPVCKKSLHAQEYDIHVQNCILGMCDDFDKKYDTKEQTSKTPCLACGKHILKSDLDSHLEDCMSMTNVFETSNVLDEDDDDEEGVSDQISQEDSYNCPFCLKLVLEQAMQAHLDSCLVSEDACDVNVKEKSLLVESLCNSDSDFD